MTDELDIVVNAFDVSNVQLRNMIIAGFKGSFFPDSYTEKRAYVRQVINHYDKLEAEFLK